jgi:phosphonate transport system substrate-binding protein
MSHRVYLLATPLLLALLIGTLTFSGYRLALDLSMPYADAAELYVEADRDARADTVFFGVISRYPSNIIYQGYQPLMDYLTAATGYHFVLRLSESYDDTVQQLVEGRVSVAFLGSYLYVKANAEHGIICILQPLNEDAAPQFQSVLVTHEQSDIVSLRDLSGRRLALPSELSFSANWLALHELDQAGLRLADLSAVRHFPHHHTVIYEVLRGNFDAGVVKDRVAREFLQRGVRIVASSDPIPGSPIVLPASHDPALAQAITTALLRVDPADSAFAALVSTWDPEFAYGFTKAQDADYDVIRAMLKRRGARP